MQLKMKETTKSPGNTPKGIKKTPKKVKQTPLKKNESLKTPNKVKDTPLKKNEAIKTPKTITDTPKSGKKKPKQNNNNSTSKPRNQEQQETPQKSPKTLKFNKKQKLDENKSKEINTHSSSKKKISLDGSRIKVSFPPGKVFNYNGIKRFFEGCKHVYFQTAMIQYDQETLPKKIEELRKIRINGKHLYVQENEAKLNLFKKIMKLRNEEDAEAAMELFKAKSYEKLINRVNKHMRIYVFTFETEEEAEEATKKQMKLDGKLYEMLPFYDKLHKNKTTSEEKKPSETKRKLKQQKRKAHQDEEESDEEEEDCDNTMEDIEMEEDNKDDEEEKEKDIEDDDE